MHRCELAGETGRVLVSKILHGSPAHVCGRIAIGDELVLARTLCSHVWALVQVLEHTDTHTRTDSDPLGHRDGPYISLSLSLYIYIYLSIYLSLSLSLSLTHTRHAHADVH
jgi:hypothetical protein